MGSCAARTKFVLMANIDSDFNGMRFTARLALSSASFTERTIND